MENVFDELMFDEPVLLSCSGGRDSTAMALLLYEYVKEHHLSTKNITILFGDTRLNLGSAIKTIHRLVEYTRFNYIKARYDGEEKPINVLKRSFMKIPKAVERYEMGLDVKNVFICCTILKHGPLDNVAREYKKQGHDPQVLLGFTRADQSLNRIRVLGTARKTNTFVLRTKQYGIIHYYPLRDFSKTMVDEILNRHGFGDTKSSGCSICPFFVLNDKWRKKDYDVWKRSHLFAKRLGVEPRHPDQLSLRDSCSK